MHEGRKTNATNPKGTTNLRRHNKNENNEEPILFVPKYFFTGWLT